MKLKITFVAFIILLLSIAKAKQCRITVLFKNVYSDFSHKTYISSNKPLFYLFDSITLKKGKDKIRFAVQDPIQADLYINNNPESIFQFYLCKGRYQLLVDMQSEQACIKGSKLNTDFKELMAVQDSLYKKYHILHAMLYPYTGMDRDSAHQLLQQYLPYCDSIADRHIKQFYAKHPASFLTLEHIYEQLSYTFENPGYDTLMYNKILLKKDFDRLDSKLRKYRLYQECLKLFRKEYPKLETPLEPLFPIEEK